MSFTHDDAWERDEQYTEAYEEWCADNEFDPDDPHVELDYQDRFFNG